MEATTDAQTRQPLSVLWWAPVRVRWWEEAEVVYAHAKGTFTKADRKSWAEFSALRQRYGGRVRRLSCGHTEVQVQVEFPARPGPVIRVCDTSTEAVASRKRTPSD